LGKESLFFVWRSELPDSDQIYGAALARFRTWALFRDPEIQHAEHVAKLALQIYDSLESLSLLESGELPESRAILQSAALAHAVGSNNAAKKPQIESYRLIRKLQPPLGLSAETLRQIALVVRFHRGSLPSPERKAWLGIPDRQYRALVLLSGILRFADAFDRFPRRHIYRLEIKRSGDILFITAPGYAANDASAEKLAGARHLLEVGCGLPILIR